MQLLRPSLQIALLASALPVSWAASGWGYTDATVSIQSKGAGVGAAIKEHPSENKPLAKPVALGGADTLKVTLTTKEGSSNKRPHQAFLLLKDATTGLDTSYPFTVKDNGKSKVELTQKDLPIQFLQAKNPIDARFVIGSFGAAKPHNQAAFQLAVDRDSAVPLPGSNPPRYGKLEEIHHIFKTDPKSPPKIISLVFVLAVLATLPILGGAWLFLGANVSHLPKALQSAPLSHALFLGSLFGLEGIFFLYYTSWNLFQTLPAAAAVGVVAFLSGSRALSEVQERRLAGLRG